MAGKKKKKTAGKVTTNTLDSSALTHSLREPSEPEPEHQPEPEPEYLPEPEPECLPEPEPECLPEPETEYNLVPDIENFDIKAIDYSALGTLIQERLMFGVSTTTPLLTRQPAEGAGGDESKEENNTDLDPNSKTGHSMFSNTVSVESSTSTTSSSEAAIQTPTSEGITAIQSNAPLRHLALHLSNIHGFRSDETTFQRPPRIAEANINLETLAQPPQNQQDVRLSYKVLPKRPLFRDGNAARTFALFMRLTGSPTGSVVLVSREMLLQASPMLRRLFRGEESKICAIFYDRSTGTLEQARGPDRFHLVDLRNTPYDSELLPEVLTALHFNPSKRLLSPRANDFSNLAEICQWLDIKESMQPWVHIWADVLLRTEQFRYIGWEECFFFFDHCDIEEDLRLLGHDLTTDCSSLSECKGYLFRSGYHTKVHLWPEDLLNSIMQKREIKINEMMTTVRYVLSKFLRDDEDLPRLCRSEDCINMFYGSFLRAIRKNGLWPLLRVGAIWHGSVRDLQARLNAVLDAVLTLPRLYEKNGIPRETHECELEALISKLHFE